MSVTQFFIVSDDQYDYQKYAVHATHAEAMACIERFGMQLCVHLDTFENLWPTGSGWYTREVSGPLNPNTPTDPPSPISRTNSGATFRGGSRNDWLQTHATYGYAVDDEYGRIPYVVQVDSARRFDLNAPNHSDGDALVRFTSGLHFNENSDDANVFLDITGFKVWAGSREGVPWDVEFPPGSGLYGHQRPEQYKDAPGLAIAIYEEPFNGLTDQTEITARYNASSGIFVGDIYGPGEEPEEFSGIGYGSDSYFLPRNAAGVAGLPPLQWDVVGIAEKKTSIDTPIMLHECVPAGSTTFAALYVLCITWWGENNWGYERPPMMDSPFWVPDPATEDGEAWRGVRLSVYDPQRPLQAISIPLDDLTYEGSPCLKLSNEGLGVYDVINGVGREIALITMAQLNAANLNLSNTRPLAFMGWSENFWTPDEVKFSGGPNVYGIYLSSAASDFWTNFILSSERI